MYQLRKRNIIGPSHNFFIKHKAKKCEKKLKEKLIESDFIGFDRREIAYTQKQLEVVLRLKNKLNGDRCENPSRGEKCFWCAKVFYLKKRKDSWVVCAKCGFFRCSTCAIKQCACRESGQNDNDETKIFSRNAMCAESKLLSVSHVVKLNYF